jgi:hypothetical protein
MPGQERDFAAQEQPDACRDVVHQWDVRQEFEQTQHESLVRAAETLNHTQEQAMEQQHIPFPGGNFSFKRHAPQPIHDGCNIDIVRAARRAGVTSHAQPDVPALENGIILPQRNHLQKQVRAILHGIHNWTSRRAFVTVIAQPDLLTQQVINFKNLIAVHVDSFLPAVSSGINKSGLIKEPHF